jgi:hypothetical protein
MILVSEPGNSNGGQGAGTFLLNPGLRVEEDIFELRVRFESEKGRREAGGGRREAGGRRQERSDENFSTRKTLTSSAMRLRICWITSLWIVTVHEPCHKYGPVLANFKI